MKKIHMKQYIRTLMLAVALAPVFSSCDYLDKEPDDMLTLDAVFDNADYTKQWLAGVYNLVPDPLWEYMTYEGYGYYMMSDETQMASSLSQFGWSNLMNVQKGSWTPTTIVPGKNLWLETYRKVRAGLIFMENVKEIPNQRQTAELVERYKNEVRFLMAYYYSRMLEVYGPFPLVTSLVDVTESGDVLQKARTPYDEIVDYLDNEFMELSKVLPSSYDDVNVGRPTSGACLALRARMLMFAASPLFNDNEPYCNENPQIAIDNKQAWFGGYNAEWWNRCWTACDDFFKELNKSGFYSLIQPESATPAAYRSAFNKAYFIRETNTELLISTRIIGKYNWDWWYYWGEWVTFGGYTPTLEYMQMFPMNDGKPFTDDYLKEGAQPFFYNNDYNQPNRDPRLYETMLVNGARYGDHAAEMWVGGRENISDSRLETGQGATGFRCYKFFKEGKGSLAGNYLEWPYLRLAEIYLIYAEACLQAKGDFSAAIANVNKVRARVGLGDLNACNPSKNLMTNKEALLEEILRERACELGLEDVRFFDMIRYKRDDLFKKALHGLRIYRNDGGGDKPWSGTDGNAGEFPDKPSNFKYEVFALENIARSWWNNFSPKWYLAAFPPSEVNKEYGLTQNPGWN